MSNVPNCRECGDPLSWPPNAAPYIHRDYCAAHQLPPCGKDGCKVRIDPARGESRCAAHPKPEHSCASPRCENARAPNSSCCEECDNVPF